MSQHDNEDDAPQDDDADVSRREVEAITAICQHFSMAVSDAWCINPARALEMLAVATEALALQFSARYPGSRDDVLMRLQELAANVATATTPTPNEVRH